MTVSTSPEAYADCIDLFDQALASTRGIRNGQATQGDAHQLYTRLHYLRSLLRAQSRDIYEPDHPEYGKSPYDSLVVRRPRQDGEKWWVVIEPVAIKGIVEELGAAE